MLQKIFYFKDCAYLIPLDPKLLLCWAKNPPRTIQPEGYMVNKFGSKNSLYASAEQLQLEALNRSPLKREKYVWWEYYATWNVSAKNIFQILCYLLSGN